MSEEAGPSAIGSISAVLNFLILPGAGRPTFPGPKPTADVVLRWLCGEADGNLRDIVGRHDELSNVFIAPAEPRILTKLAYPLRSAKGCYMLGSFLGCIALCGMVSEMVGLLLWELSLVSGPSKRERWDAFEKLGQAERVKKLHKAGLLSAQAKHDFDLVRTTRRGHLHFWSKDTDSLPKDAKECFEAAVRLVVFGLGLGLEGSKLVLRPGLIKYLQDRDVFHEGRPSHQ